MATTWKVSTANSVTVDLSPYDLYGEASGFKLFYKERQDANTTDTSATFTEVIHTVGGATETGSAWTDGLTGDTTITLDVGQGVTFSVGMVLQVTSSSEFVYVYTINNDVLTLRRPLKNDITSTDTLTEVGNTGVYQYDLTLGVEGQYTIIIENPSIGLLNEVAKVEVVTYNLDDINTNIDDNETKIDTIDGNVDTILATIDTEIGALQSDVTAIKDSVDTEVGTILSTVSSLDTKITDLQAVVGGFNAISGKLIL